MLVNHEPSRCLYRYDPLDRLVDCTPSTEVRSRRFYSKERLATEIRGEAGQLLMQHADHLLAQQQHASGTDSTRLFATDSHRSVLNTLDPAALLVAYAPYGQLNNQNRLISLLGFNGEPPDPVTGCYLLGNGYRLFSPLLMRFNSPDSWSPFARGGLNAYAYCMGDPINRQDPTGHRSLLSTVSKFFSRLFNRRRQRDHDARSTRTGERPFRNHLAQPDRTIDEPPPNYESLFSEIILEEPTIEVRFQQAIRRLNNHLDHLEMLRNDPAQGPAWTAIDHDIKEIHGRIQKQWKYLDEIALPTYATATSTYHNKAKSIRKD